MSEEGQHNNLSWCDLIESDAIIKQLMFDTDQSNILTTECCGNSIPSASQNLPNSIRLYTCFNCNEYISKGYYSEKCLRNRCKHAKKILCEICFNICKKIQMYNIETVAVKDNNNNIYLVDYHLNVYNNSSQNYPPIGKWDILNCCIISNKDLYYFNRIKLDIDYETNFQPFWDYMGLAKIPHEIRHNQCSLHIARVQEAIERALYMQSQEIKLLREENSNFKSELNELKQQFNKLSLSYVDKDNSKDSTTYQNPFDSLE